GDVGGDPRGVSPRRRLCEPAGLADGSPDLRAHGLHHRDRIPRLLQADIGFWRAPLPRRRTRALPGRISLPTHRAGTAAQKRGPPVRSYPRRRYVTATAAEKLSNTKPAMV